MAITSPSPFRSSRTGSAKGAGDTEVRQGGTDRTHHDGGVKTTLWAYNDATNQDIRIRPDEPTRAQVTQLTRDRRIVQVIDFDQSHTGSTVLATDNGRVEAGSRVVIMADSRSLVGSRPWPMIPVVLVVVCRDDGSGGVMQLQNWVGQAGR